MVARRHRLMQGRRDGAYRAYHQAPCFPDLARRPERGPARQGYGPRGGVLRRPLAQAARGWSIRALPSNCQPQQAAAGKLGPGARLPQASCVLAGFTVAVAALTDCMRRSRCSRPNFAIPPLTRMSSPNTIIPRAASMSSERRERSGSFWSPPNLAADQGRFSGHAANASHSGLMPAVSAGQVPWLLVA